MSISPDFDRAWALYEEARRKGHRRETLAALGKAIEELERCPEELRRAWSERFLSTPRSDHVYDPLFQRVLLPVLVAGVVEARPGYARWLSVLISEVSGADRLVYASPLLPEPLKNRRALLELALFHDPEDSRARRLLIEAELRGIEYSLHEVPSGVLYSNGATADECALMLAELPQFEALLAAEGLGGHYQEVLDYARFHYTAYRDYLIHHRGQGYPNLLAQEHWGSTPERPSPQSWYLPRYMRSR